jgi:hypothetical protein
MSKKHPFRLLLALLAVFALVASACGDDSDSDDSGTAEGELSGLFEVADGTCDDAGVPAGSYFRMVEAGGSVEDGPFIANGDSTCAADTTFTLLAAGVDGGLLTGEQQPAPDPAFDDAGAALADGVIAPIPFFGQAFAAATEATDVESGDDLPAPTVTAADGVLSGDVSAFFAYWGNEVFNQGAPKPGGDEPGPIGTYDAETGDYVLEWSSQIVGGAFNDFTGVWHLEGTFAAG